MATARLLLRPLPEAGMVARRMAVDQRVPLSEPLPREREPRETQSAFFSASPREVRPAQSLEKTCG